MISVRFARRITITALAALLFLAAVTGVIVTQAAGANSTARLANASVYTAFTYQGILKDGEAPAEGLYDLRFRLFDTPLAGSQVAPPVFLDDVDVNGGLFSSLLDFGQVFDGSPRYLEVAVRPGRSNDPYTVLSPRQRLTPVPSSIYASAAPWDGLTGVPSGIADGDDDTTYGPGFGLSLDNGQFTVNTTQIQQRVTGACSQGQMIRVINSDGTVTCATDTNTTYGAGFGLTMSQNQIPVKFMADTTILQQRVSGACSVGQAIASINEDGSVTCRDVPILPVVPRPLNSNGPIDQPNDVGQYTSITIGSDGLPIISHYDVTNGDLRVVHCNNPACSSRDRSTLDSTGNIGLFTAITIGADGLGLISYYDSVNGDLKVVHCNNLACTDATATTLDSTGDVGRYTSITVGSDGFGVISYYDVGASALNVAHCDNIACTTFTSNTVDDNGDVGKHSSITIGIDGLPLISYYDDENNNNLKVAHCNDAFCSEATVGTIDATGDVGKYSSITIGADGRGLISYIQDEAFNTLKVAHCANLICSSEDAISVIDNNVGIYTSITTGADGLSLISYYANGSLKVAHCRELDCSGASDRVTLDSVGDVGLYNSITTGPNGLAYISYYRADQPDVFGNLKLARTVMGSGVRNR